MPLLVRRLISRQAWTSLPLALFVISVPAQTWKEVVVEVDSSQAQIAPGARILLDEGSPAPSVKAGMATFRYRSIRPSPLDPQRVTTLEYDVVVNCTALSIQTIKVQGVLHGYNTDVELSASSQQAYAADPFSPLGRAAMQACEAALPGSLERFRSVPNTEQCRQTRSPEEFALCKADGLRLSIGVIRERTLAVAIACGDQPVYAQALDQALDRAVRCIARAQCVRWAVSPLALAIATDVARLENEGVQASADCESARLLRQEMARAHQQEQASQDMRSAEGALSACAAKALRRFDDGVSAVEAVSKAAVSSCKSELGKLTEAALHSEPAVSELMIRSRIEEDLVATVLERRAKSRRR